MSIAYDDATDVVDGGDVQHRFIEGPIDMGGKEVGPPGQCHPLAGGQQVERFSQARGRYVVHNAEP